MVFFAPSSATLKLVMKPSSFRMRAISVFSLEAGTSTFGWRAWIALRTRVSMSAMGSLVIKLRWEDRSQKTEVQHGAAGTARSPCDLFLVASRFAFLDS